MAKGKEREWRGGTASIRYSPLAIRLLPVMLDARGAQAGEAMLVDRGLPAQKLLGGEGIAAARLLEAEEAATDRRHHLRLASDDPTTGVRRGKIGDRERTAVRPDHILHPRAIGFGHGYAHTLD